MLVDANQHVDREAAARSGVGFYGKNTMLITRRYGSWVVLGTLVTDVELEPTPPLDADCGSCTLCIDACPTGALDEPGDARRDALPLVLDAGAPSRSRSRYREPLGDAGLRLRHLPGRLPVEPRRREAARRRAAAPAPSRTSSLVDWLEADRRRAASTRYDRLFVPRNDPRYLRRNALVALGNVARRSTPLARALRGGDDPLLREHAEWALRAARGAA